MMRNQTIIRTFLVAFLTVALMLAVLFLVMPFSPQAQPRAEKGFLDLDGWDFQKEGIVRLDGEWEFYWGKLLTPGDFSPAAQTRLSQPEYVQVPSPWDHAGGATEHTAFGAATYRLKAKLGQGNIALGLKTTSIRMANRIFVNGEEIGASGNPAMSKADYSMRNVSYVGSFFASSSELEIIIQVADYDYRSGGIVQSLYLGKQDDVFAMAIQSNFFSGIVSACLLISGLYFLFVFLGRHKDMSALYYSAYVLLFFVFELLYGERALMQMLPGVHMEVLFRAQDFALYLSIMFAFLFVSKVRKGLVPRLLRLIISAAYALYAFACLLLPISIATRAETVFLLLGVLLYLYIVLVLCFDFVKKRYGSWGKNGTAYLLASFFCVLINFLDSFLYISNIRHDNTLGYMALLVFVTLSSFMLSQQYNSAYATIQDMNVRLLELDKLKDEFLANTSHELRTPLNGMINLTQSVLDDPDSHLKQERRNDLRIVIASGRRLNGLINDILDMSTLKRGEIKLALKPVDVKAVAAVTLQVLARLKGGKQITFHNNIPDDLPSALADEARLGQIYYNLLGNAVKFTKSGAVSVGGREDGGLLELWVEDTGCGIGKEDMEKIFIPFYKGDDGADTESYGTGLGLSITKQLVTMHGGAIGVQSSPGIGTRFTFALPVSGAQKGPAVSLMYPQTSDDGAVSMEMPFAKNQHGKYTILVAEDDMASLRALSGILHGEGYSVSAVGSGRQALQELETQSSCDLVILDVMMPGMTGLQVLEQIRRRFAPIDLPVLLLTAKTRPEDIRVGLDSGANDYITKPFEAEELKARVRTLVQLKQSIRSVIAMELSFLRAQINPHFLYNALSVISSLSLREPKQAKQLLLHLSDYLRGSFQFEKMDGLTSLHAELNTVEAYLAIEKARFKDRLRVVYDVEEGIAATLPVLCLQPMVENAVKHGLMGKLEGGTVRIQISLADSILRIVVEDDGIGIPEDRLSALLNAGVVQGVGLRNVHRRLMTLYGHGVQIESAPMQGTRITMLIPQTTGRD